MPDTNKVINTTEMSNAQVREIEFSEMFGESIKKLVEALGVTRKVAKQAGTVLKCYKASGTLESGAVDEGAVIPLSKYIVAPLSYKEITMRKWRKQTTAEAIISYGHEQAVTMTTDRMLKDVQKGIRSDLFDFLAYAGTTKYKDVPSTTTGATLDSDGTHVTAGHYYITYTDGTTTSGNGMQAALANAWGNLQVLFEDDDINSVYFMNPLDVAGYLATANITTQNAFGMNYVKDFMGLGTVILNASVPRNKIYATAADNLVLYYIPVNGADLNEGFNFTSDATGYVGIHETPDYSNMTVSDTVVCGIELFAERIDGVVVATIA